MTFIGKIKESSMAPSWDGNKYISSSLGTVDISFGTKMPSCGTLSKITHEVFMLTPQNTIGNLYSPVYGGKEATVDLNTSVFSGGIPGIPVKLSTGTETDGYSGLSSVATNDCGSVIFYDGYTLRMRNSVKLDSLSATAQNFQFYSGFINTNFPVNVGLSGVGCYFYYNHTNNAGKLSCIASTTIHTDIKINQSQVYTLELEVTNDGETKFWVDKVLVASLIAPRTSNPMKIIPGTLSKKSGTANRNAFLLNPFCLEYEFLPTI
jgi:hypothetical protein